MTGYIVNLTFVADPDDMYGTDENCLLLYSEKDYNEEEMGNMFAGAHAFCNGYNKETDDFVDYDDSPFYKEGCNSDTLVRKFIELNPDIKHGSLPMTIHHIYNIYVED